MRTPLKLNRDRWPRLLTAILPCAADPRLLLRPAAGKADFSDAVSALKFGATCKTTVEARFPLTLQALSRLSFERPPVVLDIGASDGVTSLDVMRALRFERYYVTDKHLEVFSQTHGRRTYFYDSERRCILAASDAWIAYADTAGAIPPCGSIARSIIAAAPVCADDATRTILVREELRRPGANVCVQRYDVFEPWTGEKVDLVLAANILHFDYFGPAQLARAITNVLNALRSGGRLAVVRNRTREAASIFRIMSAGTEVEQRINGGSEIEDLVLSCRAEAPSQSAVSMRVRA
jgi:hypothetical protein